MGVFSDDNIEELAGWFVIIILFLLIFSLFLPVPWS